MDSSPNYEYLRLFRKSSNEDSVTAVLGRHDTGLQNLNNTKQ